MINALHIFQEYSELAIRTGAVNLAQGIPEPLMNEELQRALDSRASHHWQYVEPEGLQELRAAIAQLYPGCFSQSDVVVTSGCTESLFVALAAGRAHGSKLCFFEPFYPYYSGIASVLHLTPKPVRFDFSAARIAPDWDALRGVMQRARGTLLINSPHNPTGWSMTVDEARLARSYCERYGWRILLDHAYLGYEYHGRTDSMQALSLLAECPSFMVAGSASKLLSATGLRIGWLLTRPSQFDAALSLHMCLSYCQPLLLQLAVATLLRDLRFQLPAQLLERYRHKRDILCSALSSVGLSVITPEGGHFLLADYRRSAPDLSSRQYARYLQQRAGVVSLPVDPFYTANCPTQVRFSFGASLESVRAACERVQCMHDAKEESRC